MTTNKTTAIKEKYTKSALLADIAEQTGLTKKEVDAVLNSLDNVIGRHIKKRGCGEFVFPGLFKITTKKKPATKAKKDVPNPFKPGELMDVPAKPASMQVKVKALKKLKDYATE